MNYTELLTLVAPEALLVVAALGVLLVDLTVLRTEPVEVRMRWCAWLTIFGCLTGGMALMLSSTPPPAGYLEGVLVLSPLSQTVKAVLLLLTICTALVSIETRFTDHPGEYFALLLLAAAGMLFLVGTENLLLLFVSLELLSLTLYAMTAFNKRQLKSAEAALKYFLFGGVSTAFLLFGLSLIYGLSGEMNLTRIAVHLAAHSTDPLLLSAMLMVVIGFGFKIAAVPFHLWAPDAYEGAPLPSAAFIASGSKVASFFILAKVMMVGFAGTEGSGAWRNFAPGWMPILAIVAALSVVVGNLAAIAQRSVRRLLAYSAVAHAGYLIVGVLANPPADGLVAVLYYVSTYALTAVGTFAVITLVQGETDDDQFTAFAGLSRRAPLLAFCLMVFLLSLAGIPPLAGFFGKFYLFKSGLFMQRGGTTSLGLLWLVALALSMSAVSLYYYLQVLKQVFVVEAPIVREPLKLSHSMQFLLGGLAAAIILLGCFPHLLLDRLIVPAR